MSNILDFCYQKLNYIIDQLDMYVLKNGSQIHFYIPYSKNEKLSSTITREFSKPAGKHKKHPKRNVKTTNEIGSFNLSV